MRLLYLILRTEPGWELFTWLYLYVGLVDDRSEGGNVFWRWDFWNSRAISQRLELEKGGTRS
jgi:hypothetical protein